MGNNIASERVRLDMSRDEFADALNKFNSNVKATGEKIRNWEEDRTDTPARVACVICDMCGCSLDYLMARTDDRLSHARRVAEIQCVA